MQCILYKIYFWKVFHLYYNLICILYALLCGQNFILVKSGCYKTWFPTQTCRGKTTEISRIWIQTTVNQWLITIKPRYSQLGFSWEQLHASLRTHLIHSSAYHPQTDGQTEWVNKILEDMLSACVMEYQESWDKNLPRAEFSYNNNY
jgi:hypothetical protein